MIDYYDHIDDYVNGLLQGEELKAFVGAMAEDVELAAAVENHGVAMDVIGSLIEDEVREVIGEVESEEDLSSTAQVEGIDSGKGNVRWMRILRGVAAACVVGIVGYWGIAQYQYNELEKKIFNNIPILAVNSSKGETKLEQMDSLAFYYATAQYEEAVNMIEKNRIITQQLSNQDKKNLNRIKIYSHFYLNQYQEAIDHIELLDSIGLDDKKMKYYSLVLLDRKSEAQALLKTFPPENSAELIQFLK